MKEESERKNGGLSWARPLTTSSHTMDPDIAPKMPISMIKRRSEILALISTGKSNKWIPRNYEHGRSLVREALARDLS
jgi:DNA-binding CsgD family transcriptional regulator